LRINKMKLRRCLCRILSKLADCLDDYVPGFTWIKYKYWWLIPYDWRPMQIWYRVVCFIWHRYTTIKPKTLKYHTWCDRSVLLPHIMFEVLSQFIEQECSPDHVDWEASNHTVLVNGKIINVRDEMQALYDWWHKVYNDLYIKVDERIWKRIEPHSAKIVFIPSDEEIEALYPYEKKKHKKERYGEMKSIYPSTESEIIAKKGYRKLRLLEQRMERELNNKMHRLVNLVPYLWT